MRTLILACWLTLYICFRSLLDHFTHPLMQGGAVFIGGGSGTFYDCTFTGNTAVSVGVGITICIYCCVLDCSSLGCEYWLHVFFHSHCVGPSLMHPTWFVSVATFSRGHAECKIVCARVWLLCVIVAWSWCWSVVLILRPAWFHVEECAHIDFGVLADSLYLFSFIAGSFFTSSYAGRRSVHWERIRDILWLYPYWQYCSKWWCGVCACVWFLCVIVAWSWCWSVVLTAASVVQCGETCAHWFRRVGWLCIFVFVHCWIIFHILLCRKTQCTLVVDQGHLLTVP